MNRPLTDREKAAIAERRDFVREHLPEAVDFIRKLHEAGMIDGWRNVTHVGMVEDEPQSSGPPIDWNFLTGREFVEGKKK